MNRYELRRQLGAGGQGSVWEVLDVLDPHAAVRALKLIQLRDLDPGAAERAWREAQALSGVVHPGLVPCRELFRDSIQNLIGLVFDLVQGQSLAEAAVDPRMTLECRSFILDQLAAVLAHVHALGVVHRDLKPANVLITDAFWASPSSPGGVKLVDFGISAPAGNPSPITTFGSVIGTTPYLPPELVDPQPSTQDREGFARDVFAFGVLGWELLFGVHPTGLPKNALFPEYRDIYRAASEHRRAWPPASADGAWVTTLRACLALSPRFRPANGAALRGPALSSDPSRAASGATQTHYPSTGAVVPPTVAHTPVLPVVPRTAPMPSAPFIAPPPVSTPPVNRSFPWLALGLAAGLGAFGFWLLSSRLANSETPLPPPILLSSTIPQAISPNVVSPPSESPLPCCGSRSACPSERSCRPEPCDDKALPPGATWGLRMTGVVVIEGNQDLSGTHPRASVCLRNDRTGEKVCAPMSKIASAGGDRVNILHASTQDLAYGRVFVRVVEAGGDLYPETRIADNRGGIKNSILCGGMRLRVGPRDTAPIHVLAYLD